jgi:hypothetical protein
VWLNKTLQKPGTGKKAEKELQALGHHDKQEVLARPSDAD